MSSLSQSFLGALLFAALLLATNTDAGRAKSNSAAKVRGYYPTYNSDVQSPSQIDWRAYTDVLFFMVIPGKDGSLSFDPALTRSQGEKLAKDFVSEARKYNVNPILSTGGWTGSRYFSNLTASPDSRKRYAENLVNFAKQRDFAGIETDWEYPNGEGIGCNSRRPVDVINFGLLIKDMRTLWPEGEFTAAVGIAGLIGATGEPATPKETALLTENLDYINLMAYDVFGSWSESTGPIAPLHATCAPAGAAQSGETGLQVALKQGFKSSQVLLGIPGYAKRFQLTSPQLAPKTVGSQTTFYYQKKTSVTLPGGKFDDKPGKDICGNDQTWGGSFLVTELISNGWLSKDQKRGLDGFKRHFDTCSGQPFLASSKYLISYDDEESTIAKAKFAKENHMGGIYFFDTMGQPRETVREAHRVFGRK